MKQFLKALFLLLFCASVASAAYVAVLETRIDPTIKKKVELSDRQYLTNVLREEAIRELPAEQNYTIMTRENISAMLPPGKVIEDCEGSCLAETGRNIAADYICQAHVGKFGSKLTISAEIYETAGNKLVASFNGQGANVEALLKVIKDNAPEFFRKVKDGVHEISSSGITDQNDEIEEDEEEFNLNKVNISDNSEYRETRPRSSKPIGSVPSTNNPLRSGWLRWGAIIGGSALLTTGIVLWANGTTDIEGGQTKSAVGIALSLIGAVGIGFGFMF